MKREVALGQVLSWTLALAASVAALYWACLLFLGDREQRALMVAAGGLALVLWVAFHLTDRQHRDG